MIDSPEGTSDHCKALPVVMWLRSWCLAICSSLWPVTKCPVILMIHHFQYSLPPSPENQWGSQQGRLPAANTYRFPPGRQFFQSKRTGRESGRESEPEEYVFQFYLELIFHPFPTSNSLRVKGLSAEDRGTSPKACRSGNQMPKIWPHLCTPLKEFLSIHTCM